MLFDTAIRTLSDSCSRWGSRSRIRIPSQISPFFLSDIALPNFGHKTLGRFDDELLVMDAGQVKAFR